MKGSAAYPWTMRTFGDFDLYHTFKEVGNYQIVLSIFDSQSKLAPTIGSISPPREILSNNQDCDCDRGVFNISVTNTFGDIFVASGLCRNTRHNRCIWNCFGFKLPRSKKEGRCLVKG